jgi:predicted permease
MENLIKDIRFGVRSLLKHPGFTAIALLTLALGVGANSTIFSVVNATLMRPLPVADPDSLVFVFSGGTGGVFSYPDYAEQRDQNQVLDGLTAWGGISVALNSDDQTDQIGGAIVSGNYFRVLGVGAQLGRVIGPEDDQTPGGHPVVVLSHGFWQRRFGGDRNVIGRSLLLNGQNFTVIGVTPPEFGGAQFGIMRDLYVPMMMQATMRPPRAGYSGEMNPDLLKVRRNRWLFAAGRLKPGVSLAQAQTSLAAIARQQEEQFPDSNKGRGIVVAPFSETSDPQTRSQLNSVAALLMSVVGVVLLIACANVANLLLARGSARTKEIGVRLAIGATRWRIVRQLLTESLLLSTFGGALGLVFTWWASTSLQAVPPPAGVLPVTPDFAIDNRVLLFTFALSLLAGIIFGLAPALRISRPEILPALKDPGWSQVERSKYFNLKSLLVITQVALSVLLLIAAGLFLRSIHYAQRIDPGFDFEKLVVVPLNINLLRYTRTQGREFYRQAVERVAALPGVESVSLARIVSLSGSSSVRSLLIEGAEATDNQFRSEGAGNAGVEDPGSVSSNVVGLNYFKTMGIGLLRGRDFNGQDSEDKPRVVIVNESFVRKHFGGKEAVGKRVSFNAAAGPWNEIVGVVRDSKYLSVGEPATPVAYLPLQQNHETGMTLHVRASGNPATIASSVRREVQALERNLPIANPTPMSEWITNSLYAARMGAILIGVFGSLALLLASIGLYGVMSFSVSRRTREIGVRMALGAQTGDVLKLVLSQGMRLVVLGLVVGLAGAAMITRLLKSFLYGISTTDWLTFAGVPILLAVVALLACYLPARRATRVDPLHALRYE